MPTRPSLRFMAALLFVCAGARGAAAADGQINLEHRFPKDEKRYLRVKSLVERSNLTPLIPEPLVNTEEREWWIILATKAAPAGKPSKAEWRVDRIQGTRRDKPSKNELRFDSLRQPVIPQAAQLAAWDGRTIGFVLSPAGKLSEVTGVTTSAPIGAMPGVAQHASGVEVPFAAPAGKDYVEQIGTIFGDWMPGKSVAVGQSWTQPYSVVRPPYGQFDGTTEYKLAEVQSRGGKRIARIEFRTPLKLTPQMADPRLAASGDSRKHEVRNATYYGVVEFDADAGELMSLDSHEDIKLDLIMSSESRPATTGPSSRPAQPGMSFTFHIDERRVLNVAVSRQAPVKPIVVRTTQPAQAATPMPPVIKPPLPTTRPVIGPRPTTRPTTTAPTTRPTSRAATRSKGFPTLPPGNQSRRMGDR